MTSIYEPSGIAPLAQGSQRLPRRRQVLGAQPGTFPGTTPYTATSNLIGTQINPGATQRTQGVQGQADAARNQYAGAAAPMLRSVQGADTSRGEGYWSQAGQYAVSPAAGGAGGGGIPSYGGPSGFGYSGDTMGVRGMAVGQLTKMLNTNPDRATLASNAWNRLAQDSDAQYQGDLRSVQQKNAAMGRRGSGMATTDLGDVTQRRNEFLGRRQMELSDDAAAQALADEQMKLSGASGLMTNLGGMDTSAGSLNLAAGQAAFGNDMARYEAGERARQQSFGNLERLGQNFYGAGRDRYGDAVSERDKGYNADVDAYGFGRQKMTDLYNVEDQLTGYDRADRNELRGERDFQVGQEADAYTRRRQQMLDEEDLYGAQWNRNRDLLGLGYGAQSPYTSALNTQARNYGEQASDANSAASDLFGQWARSRRRPQQQAPFNPRDYNF